MGIESFLGQLVFSIVEGFFVVTAFVLACLFVGLLDCLDSPIKEYRFYIMYLVMGFVIGLAIFLPLHFTIGV